MVCYHLHLSLEKQIFGTDVKNNHKPIVIKMPEYIFQRGFPIHV